MFSRVYGGPGRFSDLHYSENAKVSNYFEPIRMLEQQVEVANTEFLIK